MPEETLDRIMIDPTEDLWWVFHLNEAQTISVVEPLIEQLVERDMRVVDRHVSSPYFRVILQDEDAQIYFEFSNPSDDRAPYLFLGTLAEPFLAVDSLTSRLLADRFLEYGKVCYRFLQPLYAFADSMNTYIKREDIQSYQLTHMCWAQFFGSDFVRGFGDKILLNGPAWRNENMGDGGVLYVLSAEPYLSHGPRQYWSQAKEYFAQYISNPMVWHDGLM